MSLTKSSTMTTTTATTTTTALLRPTVAFFLFLLLMSLHSLRLGEAFTASLRVQETPFGLSESDRLREDAKPATVQRGIHALSQIEQRRGFFHIFNVPYIVCFFAAKGKWPFIPPFIKGHVDSASKTIFAHNDSYIKQFCQKWVQIKTCFRPIFGGSTTASPDTEAISPLKNCNCGRPESVVYFDKNYIGNVSSETILNTIEFLEGFLPTPTKKTKKKNRVRSRLDEMDIE